MRHRVTPSHQRRTAKGTEVSTPDTLFREGLKPALDRARNPIRDPSCVNPGRGEPECRRRVRSCDRSPDLSGRVPSDARKHQPVPAAGPHGRQPPRRADSERDRDPGVPARPEARSREPPGDRDGPGRGALRWTCCGRSRPLRAYLGDAVRHGQQARLRPRRTPRTVSNRLWRPPERAKQPSNASSEPLGYERRETYPLERLNMTGRSWTHSGPAGGPTAVLRLRTPSRTLLRGASRRPSSRVVADQYRSALCDRVTPPASGASPRDRRSCRSRRRRT